MVLAFYIPSKALLNPIKRWAPEKVYDCARIFFDGVTWLGIWLLVNDVMVVRIN